jgi:hypothetical protein
MDTLVVVTDIDVDESEPEVEACGAVDDSETA